MVIHAPFTLSRPAIRYHKTFSTVGRSRKTTIRKLQHHQKLTLIQVWLPLPHWLELITAIIAIAHQGYVGVQVCPHKTADSSKV